MKKQKIFLGSLLALSIACNVIFILLQANTNYLDEAVHIVKTEVANSSNHNDSKEWLYILSAMDYVQSHIRPYMYVHYAQEKTDMLSVENKLKYQAGLCGDQVMVFIAILKKIGITEIRTVEFYNIDEAGGNHIAVEVWNNNKWVFIDVTWGTFFKLKKNTGLDNTMLSIKEIIKADKENLDIVNNGTNYNYQIYKKSNINHYQYLHSPKLDIVIDGNGTVTLNGINHKTRGKMFLPENLPHYIGFSSLYYEKNSGGVRYCLREIRKACRQAIIKISGFRKDNKDSQLMLIMSNENVHKKELLDLSGSPDEIKVDISEFGYLENLHLALSGDGFITVDAIYLE